jgi:hypothetical protein
VRPLFSFLQFYHVLSQSSMSKSTTKKKVCRHSFRPCVLLRSGDLRARNKQNNQQTLPKMNRWQNDVHVFAGMAAKFQDDNARAVAMNKLGRSRRAESIFLGEDAVQYFTKQFHITEEEAMRFGARLKQDGVFIEAMGPPGRFLNERVRYRFVSSTSKGTVHRILLQRCPGLHNQTDNDVRSKTSKETGTEDEFSEYVALFFPRYHGQKKIVFSLLFKLSSFCHLPS